MWLFFFAAVVLVGFGSAWTGPLASGHTLKHTAAAVAILLFRPRFPAAEEEKARRQ